VRAVHQSAWQVDRLWRALTALVMVVALVPALSSAVAAETAGKPVEPGAYITTSGTPGRFPLFAGGKAAPLVVSDSDYAGVVRAVGDLKTDLGKVTGVEPAVHKQVPRARDIVLIGTIGKSPVIDKLIAGGKLNVSGIAGKWETTLETVVQNPLPGVRRAFVIAGSDQRGTIYGIYETSKQSGVSPWYWWDDVPVQKHRALYVKSGRHTQGTPAVKYRGFFINDENPQLGTWAPRTFGPGLAPGFENGFNSKFYAKVFETMLRTKANYLWPAVWGRAFAEDDPANHATAKLYGVVMGTSHEAPMMRGIEEWNRHAVNGTDPYGGNGAWSFRRNQEAIKQYWRDGIRRMEQQDFEGVVTLGMRGAGDVSLPDGDGIELMQNILATQRQILEEESDTPVTEIPQVWTLYKEVQRYWDRGLRAPDDATVVFTDDNWGNMRKLPDQSLPKRSGGYGMYYHYDYVGGGRNYKWVDTNQLPNIWEQLHQTYSYGVDRLWVVNVGDMKNEELPLQFFLDYAWNPHAWPLEKLDDWAKKYAAENFGYRYAGAIADVLHEYSLLQSRRKPELLNRRISVDPAKDITTDSSAVVYDDQGNPFSMTNYREMERVTAQWQRLSARTEAIGRLLPASHQDAYYQLVLYQAKATANLYALRYAEFANLLYAKQGRAATNKMADITDARFADDQAMSDYYNNELAGGKWNGFQTQPKIGYGNVARYGPDAPWQQPQTPNHVALPDEVFPYVKRIEVPDKAEMGVAIDGSENWWPNAESAPVLPTFSPYQAQPPQYIEVFNRGSRPFDYSITASVPWLKITSSKGRVDQQIRANLFVDWRHAPKGKTEVPVTVTGPGGDVVVKAVVHNHRAARGTFVEANGYVSMEASHASRFVNGNGVYWKVIPDIGRTGDGVKPFPVAAASQTPGGDSPRLEFKTTLTTTGPVKITAHLSPRNPVLPQSGLRYAVSVDDGAPQIVDIIAATGANDTTMNRQWERNTSDNVNRTTTTHVIAQPGVHTVKIWMVDPTVVVQKVEVDTGGQLPSYLGPPESRRAR
jgi:glycosyl hydrolase family 115 (putative glucuronidase)/glycosyl hydrolase family 115